MNIDSHSALSYKGWTVAMSWDLLSETEDECPTKLLDEKHSALYENSANGRILEEQCVKGMTRFKCLQTGSYGGLM
jgi:hypothetical protein